MSGKTTPGSCSGRSRRRPKVALSLPVALVVLLFAGAAASVAGCGGSTGTASVAQPSAQAIAATDGAGSPASGGTTAKAVKVTLIMDWIPWVLDIPVDAAQQQGYYSRAGLTVKQIVPAGPTDVVKFVSTGRAQFGLYYAPDIMMAVGEGAPLVSVGSLMSHAPVGLAIAPGVHATRPKDFAGGVVGVPLIPSTRASFDSMLKAGGVKPDAVRVADPGFDLVAPLLAGKYEAVAVTEFGELVQAEATGHKLTYLDFRDWGTPDFAFLNIVANGDAVKGDPAAVRAFVGATVAGLTYAAAHPVEAVDIYVARHPELKKDLLLAQWRAAIPFMATAGSASAGAATTGNEPAGWQSVDSWNKLGDWLVGARLLAKSVPADRVVSNDYLPTP